MRFERMPWSEEAREGLARTFHSEGGFDAVAHIRENVIAGRYELWRVDGDSWAVTHTYQNKMFCWCYQGRNALEFSTTMLRIARDNGLKCVRFATRRRGLARLLKPLNPVLVEPEIYEIGVQ